MEITMENTQAPTKTVIRPNTKNMIKTAGGGFHKDDFIGNALAGLSLQQVKHIAFKCGVKVDKYDHLNNGQIRMNSGNRIRAYWKKLWEADNRTEIARVADLVGVVLADDFMDEVAILQESAGLDAIPVECIGNVGA